MKADGIGPETPKPETSPRTLSWPVTVLLLDGNGRILTWDAVAEALLGYTAREAVGRQARDILPDLIAPGARGSLAQGGHRVEAVGLAKDGREVPLEALLTSYQVGQEQGIAAVLRDRTMVRLEAERVHLHDRLAALGELAAGMAHDYNNILGAILLYTDLLLLSRSLSEEDRGRIAIVLEQAQRGATLTSQVLDFARRSDIGRRPIDLRALVLETRTMLEAMLPREVNLDLQVAGERFVVDADPGRLQQVLLNLSINARDAMPRGGRLSFRLDTFRLRPEDPSPYRDMGPGDWIRLSVSDTGEGIPPEAMPRIFEPFFTTKPSGQGTGLGLAQVYGIVKRHDGYIDVRSQPGSGTTFLVYLPIDGREPTRTADSGLALPKVGCRQTVLVVEDDSATRPALVQAITAIGYEPVAVGVGEAALAMLAERKGNFDIVLCDVHLPDGNGEELARSMSRQWPKPRFVLMSGYSLGVETREEPLGPRFRWLSKPFTINQLGAALRAVG